MNQEWITYMVAVAQHEDQKRSWRPWQRFLHWLVASWRCPCCLAQRRKIPVPPIRITGESDGSVH